VGEKEIERLVEEAIKAASRKVEEGERDLGDLLKDVVGDYEEFFDVRDDIVFAIYEYVCKELMPEKLEECVDKASDIGEDYNIIDVEVSVKIKVEKEQVAEIIKRLLEST
jgi:hypothetical protein